MNRTKIDDNRLLCANDPLAQLLTESMRAQFAHNRTIYLRQAMNLIYSVILTGAAIACLSVTIVLFQLGIMAMADQLFSTNWLFSVARGTGLLEFVLEFQLKISFLVASLFIAIRCLDHGRLIGYQNQIDKRVKKSLVIIDHE